MIVVSHKKSLTVAGSGKLTFQEEIMKPGYDIVFAVFGGWLLAAMFKLMSFFPSSCQGRLKNLAAYSLSPFDKVLVPVDAYVAYKLSQGDGVEEYRDVKKASFLFVCIWFLCGPAFLFLAVCLCIAIQSLLFFFTVVPIPNIPKALMLSTHAFSIFNAVPVPLLIAKDVFVEYGKSQMKEASGKLEL